MVVCDTNYYPSVLQVVCRVIFLLYFAPRFELHGPTETPKIEIKQSKRPKKSKNQIPLPSHSSHPTPKWNQNNQNTGIIHPGELVAKVGYFGVKSAKVCRAQMGTKPAKVGRLGPRCAKVRRGPHPAPTGASAKRSSIHAASKVAKVGAAGGPKLLKWGRLRARQGQIC